MAQALIDRLRADLNGARKSRDRDRTLLLGTTLAEARNREIELRRTLSDEDMQAVLNAAVKRREEAAQQMRAAGRLELADRETAEAEALRAYLPEPLTEEAVRGLVADAVSAGATDLGSVMRAIMPQIRGRFDGRDANRLAREALGEG
jgi:hypothetical protein